MSSEQVSSCEVPAHLVLNENNVPIDPLDRQVITIGLIRYKYDAYKQRWIWDNDWRTISKRNKLFREKRASGLDSTTSWRESFTVFPPTWLDPNTGMNYPDYPSL